MPGHERQLKPIKNDSLQQICKIDCTYTYKSYIVERQQYTVSVSIYGSSNKLQNNRTGIQIHVLHSNVQNFYKGTFLTFTKDHLLPFRIIFCSYTIIIPSTQRKQKFYRSIYVEIIIVHLLAHENNVDPMRKGRKKLYVYCAAPQYSSVAARRYSLYMWI